MAGSEGLEKSGVDLVLETGRALEIRARRAFKIKGAAIGKDEVRPDHGEPVLAKAYSAGIAPKQLCPGGDQHMRPGDRIKDGLAGLGDDPAGPYRT